MTSSCLKTALEIHRQLGPGVQIGLLIHLNVTKLKEGIKRFVL